jgi:hypothetical protein
MTGSPAEEKVSFSVYCYSIASQAMVFLGLVKDPETGETRADLGEAKRFIDVLEMLKEKTEGNRTEEETKVLMNLLFELRMRYVERSQAARS